MIKKSAIILMFVCVFNSFCKAANIPGVSITGSGEEMDPYIVTVENDRGSSYYVSMISDHSGKRRYFKLPMNMRVSILGRIVAAIIYENDDAYVKFLVQKWDNEQYRYIEINNSDLLYAYENFLENGCGLIISIARSKKYLRLRRLLKEEEDVSNQEYSDIGEKNNEDYCCPSFCTIF
jgi:hypothetical protein